MTYRAVLKHSVHEEPSTIKPDYFYHVEVEYDIPIFVAHYLVLARSQSASHENDEKVVDSGKFGRPFWYLV